MVSSQFISVAVGWELYERTRDPWALGLVGAVQVAPAVVLLLPAGNLADRYPRRNIALIAQAILTLMALGLAAVSFSGAPVWLVYALLAFTGVGRAFSAPTGNPMLAQLIKPGEFARTLPYLISSGHLASIAGPAAAGGLIALTGAAGPNYVVASVGYLSYIVMLLMLPTVPPPPNPAGRSVSDLFAGVAFVRRTPVFLGAISLDLFAVLLGGAVALLPVFARDILMVGPTGLGLLRASPSVGAVLSSLIQTRLPPWPRPGVVLLCAVLGFGIATIGFGLSHSLPLSMFFLFWTGACDSVSMVIRGTLEQALTPDRLRGRVSAVNSLFIGLSNEFGAFESGATASLFGPVASVVGGGAGTIAVVATVFVLCPALARVAPLHTLRPEDDEAVVTGRTAQPARA
jgi:MFS family permease